ncbi:hypothetical protein PMI07_002384 [Rhizobium sp. CF080]|uniref:hypothetical protein n=1 Tax=Rhizobium sp. (strain CF080) TaxID=1144310 RepID=UPI0002716F80|nr:hypothetical protein [Rhizobium sp. CF080]EUB95896.1 hypothetical protein PMI07_002384 [Rhizobium sp. CF080]
MNEIRHFPIFQTRPEEVFVEGWKQHLADTGYPENFENVSTCRPHDMAGIVLLSGELKIPRARRFDGALAPCPLCSPGSPKFEIGVLAWFPAERTVQCIGHDCARRHLGEEYSQAAVVYRRESKAKRIISIWAELQDRAPRLREVGHALLPIAKAIEAARSRLENEAEQFCSIVRHELNFNNGRISEEIDTGLRDSRRRKVWETRQVGTIVGFEFLNTYRPAAQLRAVLKTLDSIDDPLPDWRPGNEDAESLEEILTRGQKMVSAVQRMKVVRDYLADARRFLHDNNLAVFELWGTLGNSPFETLSFRRKGNWLSLKGKSYYGQHSAYFELSPELFSPLPAATDSTFFVAGFGKGAQ